MVKGKASGTNLNWWWVECLYIHKTDVNKNDDKREFSSPTL